MGKADPTTEEKIKTTTKTTTKEKKKCFTQKPKQFSTWHIRKQPENSFATPCLSVLWGHSLTGCSSSNWEKICHLTPCLLLLSWTQQEPQLQPWVPTAVLGWCSGLLADPNTLIQGLISCQVPSLFKKMLVLCLPCKHHQSFHWKRSRAFPWGKTCAGFLRYFGPEMWWLKLRAKSQCYYPYEASYKDGNLCSATWNSRKKFKSLRLYNLKNTSI